MRMAGVWDERYDEIDDIVRGRNIPSPPARRNAGPSHARPERPHRPGRRAGGRLGAIRDGVALFSGSLRNVCSLADLKLGRAARPLRRVGTRQRRRRRRRSPHRLEPTRLDVEPAALAGSPLGEIASDRVGDRLPIRLLVAAGARARPQGAAASRRRRGNRRPGMYAIGLNLLRRRKSSFIHGAEDDARELTDHLAAYLGAAPRYAATAGASRRRCTCYSGSRIGRLVTSPVLRPIVRRPPNRRACSILQRRSITFCRPASRAISAASSLITPSCSHSTLAPIATPRRRSAEPRLRPVEDVDDLDRSRMPGGRVLQVGIDRTAEDLLADPRRVDRNDVVAGGVQVDGGERAGVVVVRAQAAMAIVR